MSPAEPEKTRSDRLDLRRSFGPRFVNKIATPHLRHMEHLDRLRAALAERYTIERELGSGGMATVYLAEDVKHHRKVAVKVLRAELAATLAADRFHREIEITANLNHPHVLPLLDSGDADGFLYYVMPFVEGQSLRDKLAHEGELPIAEAVRILRDVVDALDHAHKHGVVHRDIKPDNVLLSERHALVTDFGVAKAVSKATGREKLTTEGVVLGTPAYMSPEQAAADPHIDHRADIYAVGAVAYELLMGAPPFTGTTPQIVLSAHVTEAPALVTKDRHAVPPALVQLVMKCLEKKPADRWQSAEELLSKLEALATPIPKMRSYGVPVFGVAAIILVVAASITYAGLGHKDDAMRERALAVELLSMSKEAWRGAQRVEDLARIYTMVGEYDAAIDQLDSLLAVPSPSAVPRLRIDPAFDPLRDHPRFQALLAKYEN